MKTFKFIILSLLVHYSLLNLETAAILWSVVLWFWLGSKTSKFVIKEEMKARGWDEKSEGHVELARERSGATFLFVSGLIGFIGVFIFDENFRKELFPNHEIEFNLPVTVKKTLQKTEE